MTMNHTAHTLINPQNGNLAFKLFSFEDDGFFDHIQRLNYYSLIWLKKGSGKITADFTGYEFKENSLFAFAPYQPFMMMADTTIEGYVIHFHPDFFCIHKHHKAIACNGILFNNIYQPPFVEVDEHAAMTFETLFSTMKAEMQNPALAQYELLISYLKIFLITASRLKTELHPQAVETSEANKEPFVLQKLKDAIEVNYKTKHSPAQYAEMLFLSPKTLAKMTKTYFNKTLSNLINERIIIEAKRELYLTNKTIKEIAFELGYNDEYYFSRFFKINADVSPQLYRQTVGQARGMA
jgi:AraC family transcriptional regulator, transcriptional activator of pobA